MAEQADLDPDDPVAFELLSRDLERGNDESASPSPKLTSDKEYQLAIKGRWLNIYNRFNDDELETSFRDEVFPRRSVVYPFHFRPYFVLNRYSNARARVSLKVFIIVSFVMYLLAITNRQNSPSTFQYLAIPCMILLGSSIFVFSSKIESEVWFQKVWLLGSLVMHITIFLNGLAANWSADINAHHESTRERFLFHLTHMAWLHTVVLVFFSVVVRPRIPYLIAASTSSLLIYAIGAPFLKTNSSMWEPIFSSCIMYLFCCAFNVYANWHLEQSERKAYFLSSNLEKKLAMEKEKLRQLFLRTTWLTQQLTEEKERFLRNLAEQATHMFEAERAKPLWHINQEDIKCIHTLEPFKACECKYSVVLGAGSFGTVHHALWHGTEVAMKVLFSLPLRL
jgi:hypothetical protein